jgi:hypothetical protein
MVVIDSEPIPAWRVAGQRGATANAKAQVTKPPGAATWTNETRRFLIACLHQAKPSWHRRRRRDMTPSARLSKTHCRYLRIPPSLVGTSMHLGRERGFQDYALSNTPWSIDPGSPAPSPLTAASTLTLTHVFHASHTTSAPKTLTKKQRDSYIHTKLAWSALFKHSKTTDSQTGSAVPALVIPFSIQIISDLSPFPSSAIPSIPCK